jgi:tetratricopeptide (TPR) repeat protein
MQKCLALDPYNLQTRANLGQLLSSQKKRTEARQNLEFVMRYFPDDDAAIYTLLFQIDNAMGDPRAAAEAVRFGLRMFPDDSDLKRLKLLL